MNELENISHIYRGLIQRNRVFASFKDKGELDVIFNDIKLYASIGEDILDPMSGCGGGMYYFGKRGYKTTNIELNPPSYYWQVLINPLNTNEINNLINKLLDLINELPDFKVEFTVSDKFFSDEAIIHIDKLYSFILKESSYKKDIAISLFLPFVSRFANYQRTTTDITHFKKGGLCSYLNWKDDFIEYLTLIAKRLTENIVDYKEIEHNNMLCDFMEVDLNKKYSFFVTSPPYPNYRDYSKIFIIENWVLDNIINKVPSDFKKMIGSNNIKGKQYGEIYSPIANKFLADLLEKSKRLQKKSKRDIEVYYHPYFSQYFFNIQQAYKKLDTLLNEKAVGYIVVNDNITRDICIPVGASICEVFSNLGYHTEDFNVSQISHYGNISKTAKRINSHHTRHILKVWK